MMAPKEMLTEAMQRRADYNGPLNVAFAAKQGAANFTPSMLPMLWTHHPCPYTTPIYREAWYRGLYSAACWYLLDSVVGLGVAWGGNPINQVLDWYRHSALPASVLRRVPGMRFLQNE